MHHGTGVEVRRQACGISSLLAPCVGSGGLNSDHQASTVQQQAPFSAEPSHQPTWRTLKLRSSHCKAFEVLTEMIIILFQKDYSGI